MNFFGIVESLLGLGLFGVTAGIFQRSKKNSTFSGIGKNDKQAYDSLKLLLEQSQKDAKLGAWDWDLSCDEFTWTDEIYNILELEEKPKLNIQTLREFIVLEDLEGYDFLTDEIRKGKYSGSIQYRIKCHNQKVKHISERTEVIRDDEGSPTRIVGTIQDISEQTQTIDHLSKTKNDYQLLTQTLPVGIYRSNKDGDILFVNQKMVEMFGFESAEEMVQYKCSSFYPSQKYRETVISKIESHGEIVDFKVMFRRKDNSVFIGMENAHMEGDELHGVIQDITERNSIEAEKNELISTLQRKNEDLERFAHIISHNLRSPLVNLVGLTQIMDKSALNDDNKEIMDLMVLSTNNLDMIIKDLNKTVSIRGDEHKHYEKVNLYNCLEAAKKELSTEIRESGAVFTTNISENNEIVSIPTFINNILFQILENAIKFREEGRTPKILITFYETSTTNELMIEDNGIGMDMDASRDRLFKLYEKLHPKLKGRGVGLYMTYNYINALRGTIHVESELGIGTTVRVSLPIERFNRI